MMCQLKEILSKIWKYITDFWPLHGVFLEWWNRTKSISSIWKHFSCLLDQGISKIWKKLNSHGGFLRAGQKYAARWAELAVLFCGWLKKPSWEFKFLHIFGIPSSSRHEKCCQMLEILFVLFHHSRNIPCICTCLGST